MPYLLNLVYLFLLALVSPWLLWQAVRHGKYRAGFAEKLFGAIPRRQGNRPCVWFHAVSVGEVNLLASPLAEIGRRRPGWDRLVSTTTLAGYALAKKKYPQVTVFYCPLDFSWATRAAMRRARPTLLVLAELELWPNLIRAAREQGAQVAIINGRLGDRSFRGYRKLRRLIERWLASLDLIAAQNDECAQRFLALGARPETVRVTGSMKYDGAKTDRDSPQVTRLRRLAGFDERRVVFLAGSTQEGEEEVILATFRELTDEFPELRLILAPRHPERFESVARAIAETGIPWRRRSEAPAQPAEGASDAPILLVDTVGELGDWWGTARIAFVGGSLGNRGGQNMIEPAAYGAAVSFGPNTWNFREISKAFLDARGAVVVRDGTELTAFVRLCLEQPDFAEELGRRARDLVASQLGATERTIDALLALVELEAAPRAAA